MNSWAWVEITAWWLFVADSFIYNVIAWSGTDWYESKFSQLARWFPVNKLFGLLYSGLVVWLGWALSRAEVPIFGS